jgi:hypothetical protein
VFVNVDHWQGVASSNGITIHTVQCACNFFFLGAIVIIFANSNIM